MPRIALLSLFTSLCALGWWPASPNDGHVAPVHLSGPEDTGEVAPHPHFKKTLKVSLGRGKPTVEIAYQTATFNREGASKMPEGAAWHLAGATLKLSEALEIGGCSVPAGTHNLMAQKPLGMPLNDVHMLKHRT